MVYSLPPGHPKEEELTFEEEDFLIKKGYILEFDGSKFGDTNKEYVVKIRWGN